MKTLEQLRAESKLKLWDTPGFSQFIEDLHAMMGPLVSVKEQAQALKNHYSKQIDRKDDGELKQIKLPFNF